MLSVAQSRMAVRTFALILVVFLSACGWQRNGSSAEVVKIGAILPLTGELSFIGEQMQRGMELALRDYPDAGIQLVYEDDQTFDHKTALTAVNKLVDMDKAVAVLNPTVNTIKVIAPVLNKSDVSGIVFWDNTREIKNLGEAVFGVGFSTELAGEDMAIFARRNLGMKNVAVISHQDEWSAMIAKAFIVETKRQGGEVLLHEQLPLSETDFRTSLIKAKAVRAEALYFPFFPRPINDLVRQARELGFDGKLLSADGFTHSNVDALQETAEGIYFTQLWLEDADFSARYQAASPGDLTPIDLAFAGIGYDAVKLMVDVVDKLRRDGMAVTPTAIKKYLVGFPINGVTGKSMITSERTAIKREAIFVVKNGAIQPAL